MRKGSMTLTQLTGVQTISNGQKYLHLGGYGTLFSGIKKLVAGLSILLIP